MKLSRGTVVYHKVMGKGIVINICDDAMIEVRMPNGIPLKFYPEELETETEVSERDRRQMEEVKRANTERAKDLYGL